MSHTPSSAQMHGGPGFRIQLDFPRKHQSLLPKLAEFETPDISDQLNRLYAVDSAIHLLTDTPDRLCGPVCTVKVFPGDNLMVHKVLDVARPGDIVVIDAHGSTGNAVLGDIICTKARHRGIAGFIVEGLIRDRPGIDELGMPVYARGTTAIGPLHRGPGEINYPVCCGGVVVSPGDFAVADPAGIVIVPQDVIVELLERLQQKRAGEANYLRTVQNGDFSNEWVDLLLEQYACPLTRGAKTEEPDVETFPQAETQTS